jgi:hypothetical protein
MQVERDHGLILNLIEKERPETIIMTGVRPDPEGIIACRFDPGLFELTLKQLSEKMCVRVKIEGKVNYGNDNPIKPQPRWYKKITGAMSAQLQSLQCREKIDTSKKIVLVSPQVFSRIGSMLLTEAVKQNLLIVSTEADFCKQPPTIYTLCGKQVSVLQRLKVYLKTAKTFKQLPKDTWSTAFTKGNIDYGEIAGKALCSGLEKFLWHECYRLLLLKATINKVQPTSLLVLYDHGIAEACSVYLAKYCKVNTITIQHGISNPEIPGYLPIRSDKFACWGEREREILQSQGADKKLLYVTGFPGLDSKTRDYFKGDGPFKNKQQGPMTILIATQGVEASVEWRFALMQTALIVKAIAGLSLDSKKYNVQFRLHPNETLGKNIETLALKNGISMTKGISFDKQLESADIVVTQFSTVGIEALLYNKPLVSLNWVGTAEPIPFSNAGVAARSLSPEDFEKSLHEAVALHFINAERVQRFVSEFCGTGYGAERLIALAMTA